MSRCRVQVFYEGRVQGVGFRYAVKTQALGFEITGQVRNLPDGRVEMVAEGSRSELESFLEAIRESEVGRFIVREQPLWGEAQNDFRGFAIVS